MEKESSYKWIHSINAGFTSGTVFVPHPVVLRYLKPGEIIERFRSRWGSAPSSVVLPLTAPDGVLLEGLGVGVSESEFCEPTAHFESLAASVREFAKSGCDIYLSLDPTLPFVRDEALFVVDTVNRTSSHVCIGNPQARNLMAAIVGLSVERTMDELKGTGRELAGVVLDGVNLWPLSASEGRIEATCFCRSCVPRFEEGGIVSRLQTFPGPLNLGLRDTGTGIDWLGSLSVRHSPDDVVGLSRKGGFTKVFEGKADAELTTAAAALINYLRLRHELTTSAVSEVFRAGMQVLEDRGRKPASRVLVLEGTPYNWTSGVQLERLGGARATNHEECCDEVWLDNTNQLPPLAIRHRVFMWKRSVYYLGGFFNYAARARDPIARAFTKLGSLSPDQLRQDLKRTLAFAVNGALEKSALGPLDLPSAERPRMIVAPVWDKELGEKYIRSIEIPEGISRQEAKRRVDSEEGA